MKQSTLNTLDFTTPNTLVIKKDILMDFNFWFGGVACIVLAMLGILMNSITLYILRSHSNMKVMFNYLLSGVLISNNIYLLTRILTAYIYDISFQDVSWLWILPQIVYPIEHISLTASIFITISIAHQRWAITWDPLWLREISASRKSRRRRTLLYILPAITIATIVNIPKFFCYVVDENRGQIEKSAICKNSHFVALYENLFKKVVDAYAPITLLILFNWSVYNFIKSNEKDIQGAMTEIKLTRASFQFVKHKTVQIKIDENEDHDSLEKHKKKTTLIRARNKSHTTILFTSVIVFVFCHGFNCLPSYYNGLHVGVEIKIVRAVARFLIIFNSSINPFIYVLKNKQFRENILNEAKRLCCVRKKAKSASGLTDLKSFTQSYQPSNRKVENNISPSNHTEVSKNVILDENNLQISRDSFEETMKPDDNEKSYDRQAEKSGTQSHDEQKFLNPPNCQIKVTKSEPCLSKLDQTENQSKEQIKLQKAPKCKITKSQIFHSDSAYLEIPLEV